MFTKVIQKHAATGREVHHLLALDQVTHAISQYDAEGKLQALKLTFADGHEYVCDDLEAAGELVKGLGDTAPSHKTEPHEKPGHDKADAHPTKHAK